MVEITPDTNATLCYKLSWKQHPQPWSEASSKLIHLSSSSPPNKIRVEAEDLLPSTTYCLRSVMVDANSGEELSAYSPELIVDTEAVGCTPGQKQSSCCVVQ